MPHHFYSNFIRLPVLLRILIIALTIILFFGFLIFFIEPDTFETPFDGIWWAIITASTVGYGDFVPRTTLGKLTGIVLILFGAGFISTYLITLARIAVTRQNDHLEGKVMFKGKNHIIIVGWNERSREMIHKLLKRSRTPSIILIDRTLKFNPLKDYHVHFVQGRSNIDEVLLKANVLEAEKVVITADQNLDELQADMTTILTLLAIKGLNPHVTCVVEILTSEQVANAKRAGADKIIRSNIITSSMMMNGLSSEGMVDSLLNLFEQLDGSRVVFKPSSSFVGDSFVKTNLSLLKEGYLLLGIMRGEETFVNPPQSFVIKENDVLLVITS